MAISSKVKVVRHAGKRKSGRSKLIKGRTSNDRLAKGSLKRNKKIDVESRKAASAVIRITRSISACKRCRQKKIKCSHDFPRCKGCIRANVDCVSIDPATGREIPRSYIVYLESEVERLKKELGETDFQKADGVNHVVRDQSEAEDGQVDDHAGNNTTEEDDGVKVMDQVENSTADSGSTAPSSFFGASSGITFAKLMFTALNFKTSDDDTDGDHTAIKVGDKNVSSKSTPGGEKNGMVKSDGNKIPSSVGHDLVQSSLVDTSMMKDFAQNSKAALLPPKQQAVTLLSLYFSQSNAQLPIFRDVLGKVFSAFVR